MPGTNKKSYYRLYITSKPRYSYYLFKLHVFRHVAGKYFLRLKVFDEVEEFAEAAVRGVAHSEEVSPLTLDRWIVD